MNSTLLLSPLLMHIDTLRLLTPFLLTRVHLAALLVLETDQNQHSALLDLQKAAILYEAPKIPPMLLLDRPTREEFAFRFNLPLYGIQRIPSPVQRVTDRQWFHESYSVLVQFAELMEAAMNEAGITQNYNVFLLWSVYVLGVDPREHDREVVQLLGQQAILNEIPERAVQVILGAIDAVNGGFQP